MNLVLSDRALHWLALARVRLAVAAGIPRIILRGPGILEAFRDPSSLAAFETFEFDSFGVSAVKVVERARQNLLSARWEAHAAAKVGARVIDIEDDEYPALLREIADPPAALFVRGRIEPCDARAVAVIGSREATRYGIAVARKIVPPLAMKGVTVVSGMARGVDSAAHEAALSAGGRTIAVLGTGIDVPYPNCSRDLWEQIPEAGAVISEARPGQGPERWVFPERNRIISGICTMTVVCEAKKQSGTSITARLAGDQGRLLGVVPGDVDMSRSEGTNAMLYDGAHPIRTANDVLGVAFPGLQDAPAQSSRSEFAVTDPTARAILECLANPSSMEFLAGRISLPLGRILAALSALEASNLVARDLLGRYARVGDPDGRVVIPQASG